MPWAATGSPCAGLSPQDPSWGGRGPGEKTALRGSQGKMGEQEPAHGKGNPRRAAAQAGNPRKRGRIGAQRPAGPSSGTGRLPFSFPLGAATSPRRLRKAQEGPARHSGSRSPPNHRLGWSWRPAAGTATEGMRPSHLVWAGRTETRRDLQAAASGARTAPIMKGRGPPGWPEIRRPRPAGRRSGVAGQSAI